MSIDNLFEVMETDREVCVQYRIGANVPKESREAVMKRASNIVIQYEGRDRDALSVLAEAAEKGRFEEFARKLEDYHKRNLQGVDPRARRLANMPEAIKVEKFFRDCYQTLGIKP